MDPKPYIHSCFDDISSSQAVLNWVHGSHDGAEQATSVSELYVLTGLAFAGDLFAKHRIYGEMLARVTASATGQIVLGKIVVVSTRSEADTEPPQRLATASPLTSISSEWATGLFIPQGCLDDAMAMDDLSRRVEALASIVYAASIAEFMANRQRYTSDMTSGMMQAAGVARMGMSFIDIELTAADNLPAQMENRATDLAALVLTAAYEQTRDGFRNGLTGYPHGRYVPTDEPYRTWLYKSRGGGLSSTNK